MTPLPPGWTCPRRVGFLFRHGCHRITPLGCPDCQNGSIDDPYLRYNRYEYTSYDDYDDGYYIGSGYDTAVAAGAGYESSMEFTEGDGADLVSSDQDQGQDQDQFENDTSES
jgi:hypothetical protein